MKICLGCGRAGDTHKSPPHGFLERIILPALLLRPYRCKSCGNRFYSFRFDNQLEPESEAKFQERMSPAFLPLSPLKTPSEGKKGACAV